MRKQELIGESAIEVEAKYADAEALRQALSEKVNVGRGLKFRAHFGSGESINCAVISTPLQAGDEVAFFPPVTGEVKMAEIEISVQTEPFDQSMFISWTSASAGVGRQSFLSVKCGI